jgi:hypothetical protein
MINVSISGEILSQDPGDLIVEFALTDDDIRLIRLFGTEILPDIDDFIEIFYTRLRQQSYFSQFFPNEESIQKTADRQKKYWEELFGCQIF